MRFRCCSVQLLCTNGYTHFYAVDVNVLSNDCRQCRGGPDIRMEKMMDAFTLRALLLYEPNSEHSDKTANYIVSQEMFCANLARISISRHNALRACMQRVFTIHRVPSAEFLYPIIRCVSAIEPLKVPFDVLHACSSNDMDRRVRKSSCIEISNRKWR